jgi:hypothetical protein
MDKRYRVVPPVEGIQAASALQDRIYTEIPAAKPDHPTCYEGEWVCSHAPCPVRMVRLRVKALFHAHLPRLRCPLCLRTLDFRHWLNLIALQEVPAEPSSEKVAPRPCRQRSSRTVSRKSSS